MKTLWKRMMCLALSAVLLMSNVPVAALATGDVVEEVMEETVTTPDPSQPATEPSQPAATDPTQPQQIVLAAETPVANNLGGPVVQNEANILVNGVDPSQNTLDGVSFDPNTSTLTLDKTKNVTTKINRIVAKDISLTIKLVGENTIDAGNEVAINAGKDLTITGEGSLRVTTSNPTAIFVGGSVEGENKKGLTIDGAVVSVETKFVKTEGNDTEALGIASANGVLIKGATHIRTNKTNPNDVYTLTDGYAKTGTGENAKFNDAPESWTADGGALEVVGEDHTGEWNTAGEQEHYKSCKASDCILIQNTKVGDHPVDSTLKYEYVDVDNHKQIFACCGAVMGGTSAASHDLSYTADGATLTATCNACGTSDSVTLSAEDGEVGGTEFGASISDPSTGKLNVAWPEIVYTDKKGNTLDTAPTEIGDYIASITLGDEPDNTATAKDEFSITKIDFSEAPVTISGEYVYSGEQHKPTVGTFNFDGKGMIQDTDYTVTYGENIDATKKGTITVEPVDEERYTGSKTVEFEIKPKSITSDDVIVTLGPALTYTGAKLTQQVQVGIKDKPDLEVTYTVADNEVTDADAYNLKITGTGNYKDDRLVPFTVAKAVPTVTVKTTQTTAVGNGGFEQPVFKGLDGQPIPGELKYTYNQESNALSYSSIKGRLGSNLKAGDPAVTIGYVFTPEKENNQNNDFTGTIALTAGAVSFTMTDNSQIDDNQLLGSTKSFPYGVTDPVSTANIKASGGDETVANSGNYTVHYTKEGSGTPEETRPLPVGRYTFKITYTGTIGGVYCEDYEVYKSNSSSLMEITKKPIGFTAPVGKHLTVEKNEDDTPKAQAVIDAIQVSEPATGAKVEYYVNNSGDPWSETIPERSAAGRYEVKYKITAENYETEEASVWTTIQPKLTAVYGQNLSQVSGIPAGGMWQWVLNDTVLANDKLAEHDVGPVGVNDDFKMQYNGTGDYFPVQITVTPKTVTPTVSINDQDGYIHIDDMMDKENNVRVMLGDDALVLDKDYTVVTSALSNRTEVYYTVQAKTGGNYVFDFGEDEISGETVASKKVAAKLYRGDHDLLTATNFPTSDLTGKTYDTLNDVKSALSSEIEADNFPESAMKYFSVYMTKKSGTSWVEHRADGAFPTDGIDYVIPYDDIGAKESDTFKVSVMDTFGANAGKEAKEITFTETDEGLNIHLTNYAAVCVAVEVDPKTEFDITASVLLDSSSSNKGKLTFKVDSKEVKTATHGKTVNVTATTSSGYSIVSISCKAENSATVSLTKVSEGNYKFTMPASDVKVTLKIKKTASSTKNPYSGDTSNIYLWLTILAASAVGLIALAVILILKRRK